MGQQTKPKFTEVHASRLRALLPFDGGRTLEPEEVTQYRVLQNLGFVRVIRLHGKFQGRFTIQITTAGRSALARQDHDLPTRNP